MIQNRYSIFVQIIKISIVSADVSDEEAVGHPCTIDSGKSEVKSKVKPKRRFLRRLKNVFMKHIPRLLRRGSRTSNGRRGDVKADGK